MAISHTQFRLNLRSFLPESDCVKCETRPTFAISHHTRLSLLVCRLLFLIIMAFELRNRRRKRPKWLRVASIDCYLYAIAILGFVVWFWFFSSVLQKVRSDLQKTKVPNRVFTGSKAQDTVANGGAKDGSQRFLVFQPPLDLAQGIGNLMNGLLAAHMLGKEFDRQVCISNEWSEFFKAFQPLVDCPLLPSQDDNSTLWLMTFGRFPVNECKLKERLASPESVLYLKANTYPHWPTTPNDFSFGDYYQPTPWLAEFLPWKASPPETVVHLRHADGASDARAGLDHATFLALGNSLPPSTFLVTNLVEDYDFFENFRWSHPPWKTVKHSALDIVWGPESSTTNVEQGRQVWSDWYTILQATVVYCTYSDFSLSAIHWNSNNVESHSIQGVDSDHHLVLNEVPWKKTQKNAAIIESLVHRTRDEMLHCDLQRSGLDGIDFDDDDLSHDDDQETG